MPILRGVLRVPRDEVCVALQVTENGWWNVNSEKTTQILALNRNPTAKGHPSWPG